MPQSHRRADLAEASSPQSEPASRFRYVIVALLFAIAVVNYVDRGALSYTSEQVIGEYGFSKANWGAVLGYFGYGYMFGAVLGGTLSDRWGPKRVWIYAGTIWSIFEMATAYAGDFGLVMLGGSALAGFATLRIVFGFAEGPAFSILNKTVSLWAAPNERAQLSSLALASTPVGAMITAPISVGLGERPSWFSFFTSRTLMCNAIGYFAFLYITFLLLTWTPKYLQDQFQYNLSSLWYVGMIPWIGSCITVVLGGRLSDWILTKTGNLVISRSWFAAVSFLLAGLCFLMIPYATSAAGVIALMTLANALNTLPNAVYWIVIIDTSPRSRTGTNSGITHFFSSTAAAG